MRGFGKERQPFSVSCSGTLRTEFVAVTGTESGQDKTGPPHSQGLSIVSDLFSRKESHFGVFTAGNPTGSVQNMASPLEGRDSWPSPIGSVPWSLVIHYLDAKD